MNSVKLGIVVVVASVVGALGGGVFARQQLASQLTQVAQSRDQAVQERNKAAATLRDAEQRALDAQAALTARNSELQRLQAAHDELADTAAVQAPAAAISEEPAASDAAPAPPPELRAPRDGIDPMEGVPRDANGNPLPPEPTVDGPSSRMDFTQRMNERMQGYYEAEAAKTNDPAVQQRLATLRDQSTYMMDVMQRMRDTMDEQERAQLQEEFQQVRANVSTLVQEQQDYMLRQVAIQSGVTDPQKQEALMNSLRETQESPFFRSPMMSWGGGGPGGRRGR